MKALPPELLELTTRLECFGMFVCERLARDWTIIVHLRTDVNARSTLNSDKAQAQRTWEPFCVTRTELAHETNRRLTEYYQLLLSLYWNFTKATVNRLIVVKLDKYGWAREACARINGWPWFGIFWHKQKLFDAHKVLISLSLRWFYKSDDTATNYKIIRKYVIKTIRANIH